MSTPTLVAFVSQALGAIALMMLLTLNARLRPLPIAFRFPRNEALVALAVLAGVALLRLVPEWQASAAYSLPDPGSVTRGELGDIPTRLLVAWISIVAFGMMLVVTGAQKPFLSVGWNTRDMRLAFTLGLVMGLLALFLSGRLWILLGSFRFSDVYSLIVWLGIGICEETIFRGVVQTRLSAWLGPVPGWVLSAVLYALWILPVLIGMPGFGLQLLVVFGRGLLHGMIYRRVGHVLAPAVYSGLSQWAFFI